MLDLLLVIVFGIMSYRVAAAVRREARVLNEFKQTTNLAWLVLLFPLGPLVLLAGAARLPFPVAFLVAAACYVPALLLARRQNHVLEAARTDRVRRARTATSQVVVLGFAGLAYVAVALIIAFGVTTIE